LNEEKTPRGSRSKGQSGPSRVRGDWQEKEESLLEGSLKPNAAFKIPKLKLCVES